MATASTVTVLPEVDLRHPAGQLRDGLREAAHEVGFFYLTGHGVAASLTDQVLAAARRLFAHRRCRRTLCRWCAAGISGAIPGWAAS